MLIYYSLNTDEEPEKETNEENRTQDTSNDDAVKTDSSSGLEPKIDDKKAKQCWDLYRKMSEKGVVVSFDTILRGMLTPTEYRIHKKQLPIDDSC